MSRLLIASEVYHAKATPENMNLYGDGICAGISTVTHVPYDEVQAMLQSAWARYCEFAEEHKGCSMLQDELQGVIRYACWVVLEEEYPGRGPETIEVVR